jgi:hypothetical protein
MKAKGSLKHEAIMAAVITILLVLLVCGLAIVAYRVESAMNIEPFVIFAVTDHMDGTYSYSIFNINGTIDFSWMHGVVEKINQFQVLIHPSFKAFAQIVSAILEGAYELVKKYLI